MDKIRTSSFDDKKIVQAVIVTDLYNDNFSPATGESPVCLMNLVNQPLLYYTLECLSSSGIQEVIIFASTFANSIKQFVKNRKWVGMSVIVIVSETCRSFGDAMRDLDSKALIRGDFILLTGNVVACVDFMSILEKHKKIQKADKGAAMTLIFKECGMKTLHSHDLIYLAMDSSNDRILCKYKEHKKSILSEEHKLLIPINFLIERSPLDIRSDLLETGINVCSVNVPPLFSDNFDFQTLDDFVRGLLMDEEIMASTVYGHILDVPQYAANASNWNRYHSISHDVIHRWTYPHVLDNRIDDVYHFRFGNIYLENNVVLAVGSTVLEDVVIGQGSSVSSGAVISCSVIGKGCKIMGNSSLISSYLFSNVIIGENCIVDKSVVADNCVLQPGSCIYSCILGPGVVISKGKCLKKLRLQASPASGKDSLKVCEKAYKYRSDLNSDDSDDDNENICDESEDWIGIHVDPIDDNESIASSADDEDDASHASNIQDDDTNLFFNEVVDSLSRGFEDKIPWDNLILEVNSSRYAYNVTLNEVNYNVSRAVMSLDVVKEDIKGLAAWKYYKPCIEYFLPLLTHYIKDASAMNDCLSAIEDICEINENVRNVVVKILYTLYENDVLVEEAILKWHSSSREDSPFRESLKKQISPFIQWLEEGEESSED